MVLELEMLEIAKQELAEAGHGHAVLTSQKDVAEVAALRALTKAAIPTMDTSVIPVVFCGYLEEPDVTYDVEVWLYDYGKKGISKIIKKTPRNVPEEERRKNRERAEEVLWGIYRRTLISA